MGLDITGIGSIADLVGKAIDKIFPDKTEAEKIKFQLSTQEAQLEFQLVLGQLQTNAEEAKSLSTFVAGWRPFIGWVCGAGFAWEYVVGPFLVWTLEVFGTVTTLPSLDASELMTILLGMLGLAGMRSYDKKQNGGK